MFFNKIKDLLTGCCVLCGYQVKKPPFICHACHNSLPHNHYACWQCALPLTADTTQTLCGNCQSSPPPFSQTIAACRYEYPIDELITQFKYHEKLHFLPIVANLLLQKINNPIDGWSPPDQLIAVPMHRKQLNQRGFNQADLIARYLSKKLNITYNKNGCSRIKNNPSQRILKAKQRKQNLKNAFIASTSVQNKKIAIIDDVMTTGATVEELAKVLLKAGAKKVDVWCIARTS